MDSGTGASYKILERRKFRSTSVIIAHSRGASMICKQFNNKYFRRLRVLILLDPLSENLEKWNGLKLTKKLVLSTEFIELHWPKNVEQKFNEKIILKDNHYFSRNLPILKKLIEKLI